MSDIPEVPEVRDRLAAIAQDAAWEQFRKMPSSNPGDIARAVVAALIAEGVTFRDVRLASRDANGVNNFGTAPPVYRWKEET